jgi:hypothetical protein
MKKYMVGFCLIISATSSFAGLEEGKAAYKNKDYATALKEFSPLAEQGDSNAQYHLGQMYKKGNGVNSDMTQAINWIRKAAEQGYPAAQYHLGKMYDEGEDLPQDNDQALRWTRKAAEQGHDSAQYALAKMYKKGEGITKNLVLAHMLYSLAATTGHKKSAGHLDEVALLLTPSQLAEAQELAAQWKVGTPLPTSTKTYPAP